MPPSCLHAGAGTTSCGADDDSCCTSLEVRGGTFERTYANTGTGPTDEADPATLSTFRLDKYDVTVGRFRQFVAAWNGGAGYTPPVGSGKHTHLNAGQGLANSGAPGTFEPGWLASDDVNISPTSGNLASCAPYTTWTNAAGTQENLPIGCVNWAEAYAFCIWDGGFLPSNAESEYAIAGGSQELAYPWGATAPGTANLYAIYDYNYPNEMCGGVGCIAPVGTATLGAGVWGQLDLVGEVWQWTLDWYPAAGGYQDPCTDCAALVPATYRLLEGGDFQSATSVFIAASSGAAPPTQRGESTSVLDAFGFRCARTP